MTTSAITLHENARSLAIRNGLSALECAVWVAAIQQISDALRTLQRMGAGGHSSTELARLREELDESLAIANKVESRIDSLLDQTVFSDQPSPARGQTEEKQKGT